MRCEIIGVGTELLLGQIVNTNAAWIGQRLADVGWDCLRHTAVGDNEARIADTIREALARADAVIVTGGLGPTQDDVTRDAIAAVAGVRLVRDPAIERWLEERFARFGVRRMATMNLRQADVPEGARTIENPRGTAPGLIVEIGGKPVYAVPGVPREMEGMLEGVVLPDLAARAGEGRAIVSRTLRTAGIGESRVAEQLTPLWEAADGVTMAYLASSGEVRVRLTSVGATRDEALARIAPVEDAVRAELGAAVYGHDDEALEQVVGRLLCEQGQSLATAESLTGGLLGGRITTVPGASDYYLGGVVAYATEAKADLLGVDQHLLDEHGPVSEPAAAAMAEGARRVFSAGTGLATSGVAGPTEQGGQPVGTLCLAVADAAGTVATTMRAPGDRAQVRAWAATLALDLLRRRLRGIA
ncbi:MAG TPA: competence/damage-inducible protein A [Actinomycetes bacterium]|jgi:nicotinamide-nucleotide amidase|nr:competence/damage-inducible protein A [Actinomycetes bacterium]